MRLGRTYSLALGLGLAGALALAVPAYVLAQQDVPLYESVAEVRLLGDPLIGDEDLQGSRGTERTGFVATELVALNSDDLEATVRRRQGDSDLDIDAEQVGTSNVVSLTTRAGQRELVGTTAVLERYTEVRRGALLTRIDALRTQVDGQVTGTIAAIDRLAPGSGPAAQVQRDALQSELSRLLQQRNTLELATDASTRLVQVLSGGSQLRQVVSPARNALLAGLLGALIGLAVALVRLRLRPRVRGLQDLVALSPEVVLPTLPRLGGRLLADRAGRAAAAYTAALTPAGSSFGTPPLVVLAPTAGAGATVVAVGLAVAAARRGPTALVAAGDALDGAAAHLLGVDLSTPAERDGTRPTEHPGLTYVAVVEPGPDGAARLEAALGKDVLAGLTARGVAVVVDAPSLADSPAGLELARRAGRALVVGGVDRSTAAELDAAARSVRRTGASLAGLVLSTSVAPWRARLRRG